MIFFCSLIVTRNLTLKNYDADSLSPNFDFQLIEAFRDCLQWTTCYHNEIRSWLRTFLLYSTYATISKIVLVLKKKNLRETVFKKTVSGYTIYKHCSRIVFFKTHEALLWLLFCENTHFFMWRVFGRINNLFTSTKPLKLLPTLFFIKIKLT